MVASCLPTHLPYQPQIGFLIFVFLTLPFSFEKADTHRFEVPRMLLEEPQQLEAYILKTKDKYVIFFFFGCDGESHFYFQLKQIYLTKKFVKTCFQPVELLQKAGKRQKFILRLGRGADRVNGRENGCEFVTLETCPTKTPALQANLFRAGSTLEAIFPLLAQ